MAMAKGMKLPAMKGMPKAAKMKKPAKPKKPAGLAIKKVMPKRIKKGM